MWVTSLLVVLFPFVPLIDTIGIRRSASRSQLGGEPRAPAIRSFQRARIRVWPPVSRAERVADTSRSARWNAASAISRARSDRLHGKVRIQCPGSDERWAAVPSRPSS